MRRNFVVALVVILIGSGGCDASPPLTKEADRPVIEARLEPHLERVQTTRDFRPEWTPGSTRECLGRLAFEVAGPIEWALDRLEKVEDNEYPLFSDGVPGDLRERAGYGKMKVMISQPATETTMHMHRDRYATAERGAGVEAWTKGIERRQARVEEAKARGARVGAIEGYMHDVESAREKLEIAKRRRVHNFGFENELATESGRGRVSVRTLMGGHIISFTAYINPIEGNPRRERSLAQIREDLRRVRVRAPGEVPEEPGVCLPGYFIADDGTGDYQVHASFRYVDRPNITYSIDTGYRPSAEAEGGIARPPPSNWRRVLSYPGVLLTLPEEDVQRRDLIPLRGFLAGGLSFDRTGMAITRKGEKRGDPSVQTYQLYGGMPGVQGVQVMPFIAVTMQAWPQHMYPQLKQGIPPLAESEQRFDALLRNLHFRHTTPEAPDYVRLLGDGGARE